MKESEKAALFHVDFSAVSEARRKSHRRVDESVRRSRSVMMEPQRGTSAPLLVEVIVYSLQFCFLSLDL